MDVSVIIPTWNNCGRLAITLNALVDCRIPTGLPWEVVVVANNCTDQTEAIAAHFADRLPLVYVEEPRQGVSRARNAGIVRAQGALLMFLDDDVRVGRDWIAHYWGAFRTRGDRHFFGGPVRCEYEAGYHPDRHVLALGDRSITGFDFGPDDRPLRPDERFLESNWACAADAVRQAGGFDPRLGLDASLPRRRGGEGAALTARLGKLGLSGFYLARAQVVHFVPRWKCELRHLGQTARAAGLSSLTLSAAPTALLRRPWLGAWLGEDKWTTMAVCRLGLAIALLAARWVGVRLTGGRAYEAYTSLQFCLGRLQGYADRVRTGVGLIDRTDGVPKADRASTFGSDYWTR